jgi:PTH1 family peptidyl-tRNA hydrolase
VGFRRKEPTAPVAALVVGLGNPGAAYRGTRHNLGFTAIDTLAERLHAQVNRKDSGAQVGQAKVPGSSALVLLAKPQTFMNLSGRAVAPLLRKHHLEPQDLWVVYDEIDLPLGRLRIREGGGAAGHKGLLSIIEALGGEGGFTRVRMGVGRPDAEDAVDHVLGKFSEDEREQASALVDLAVDAVITGLVEGRETSMNRFNGRSV